MKNILLWTQSVEIRSILTEYLAKDSAVRLQTGKLWTDLGEGRGVAPVAALPKPEAEEAQEAQEADLSETESDEEEDVVDSAGYSSDASLSSIEIPAEVRPGALRRTSSTSIPGSPSPEPSPPIQGQNEQERGVSTISTATPKEIKRSEKKSKKKQKGDVWIYASDSTYKIYLGIKQKGYFQHSSFLAGGPITSAGTLIIKNGILLGCNPMSGHYRTKAVYFKRFIEELEREGADLSQVKVGQTEVSARLLVVTETSTSADISRNNDVQYSLNSGSSKGQILYIHSRGKQED